MLALRRWLCAALVLVTGLAGCTAPTPDRELAVLTGGSPERGPQLLARHGCVACHTVSDVGTARGRVGPSLDGLGGRTFIAGRLENTPENLVGLIREARRVVPGTAMPSLGVPEQDARDLAAYLYSRR